MSLRRCNDSRTNTLNVEVVFKIPATSIKVLVAFFVRVVEVLTLHCSNRVPYFKIKNNNHIQKTQELNKLIISSSFKYLCYCIFQVPKVGKVAVTVAVIKINHKR